MAADGEIFRLNLEYSAPNTSQVLNVFHWRYNGAATANANVLAAIEDWVDNDWGPDWADFAVDDWTLIGGSVIRVNKRLV